MWSADDVLLALVYPSGPDTGGRPASSGRRGGYIVVSTLMDTNQGVNRLMAIGMRSLSACRAASGSSSGYMPVTGRPPAAMDTRRVPWR